MMLQSNLGNTLPTTEIDRHKSAIVRNDVSRPVRLALDADLLKVGTSFFDYGCGHGGDISRLQARSIDAAGWDPYYRPNDRHVTADVVNLGYVLNVIERPDERRHALQSAWNLARQVLIVSAQVLLDYLSDGCVAYGDGVITKRNTFQKYFKQEELSTYIESTLGVEPVPAGLGIFFVFRDESQAEAFRASRFHSRRSTPLVQLRTKRFEDFEHILNPLMTFVTERGRLPVRAELLEANDITREFGSLNSAFRFIQKATNLSEWEHITERRKQDLLVYCALAKFAKRPRIGHLPNSVQYDIKAFFGSYKNACDIADTMLFSLGKPETIVQKCKESTIGKLVPDGLYVHVSAINDLDPLLRLYEGCASRTIGRMDEATLVKFHTDKPKISYLFYPDFDESAHPQLHTSMRIDLRDLSKVSFSDYSDSTNPPVLHRKETFVNQNYPLYEQFSNLTKQEEAAGLLSETRTIGTKKGWQQRLTDLGYHVVGHDLLKHGQKPSKPSISVSEINNKPLQMTPAVKHSTASDSVLHPSNTPQGNFMSIDELKQFITKGMSISHVYQPAILLALFDGNGQTTIEDAAKKCSELEGNPPETYSRALSRYPIEALTKRGIISKFESGKIKLTIDWHNVPSSTKDELASLCRSRIKK